MKPLLWTLSAVLLAAPAVAPVTARAGDDRQPATRPAAAVVDHEHETLLAVLSLERESKAFYHAVLVKYRPIHPFGRVYREEVRHERMLLNELRQHGIAIPDDEWTDQEVLVPDTENACLVRAIHLEKRTVAAYDMAIVACRDTDAREVLTRLRTESVNHLKWFIDPGTCPTDDTEITSATPERH